MQVIWNKLNTRKKKELINETINFFILFKSNIIHMTQERERIKRAGKKHQTDWRPPVVSFVFSSDWYTKSYHINTHPTWDVKWEILTTHTVLCPLLNTNITWEFSPFINHYELYCYCVKIHSRISFSPCFKQYVP